MPRSQARGTEGAGKKQLILSLPTLPVSRWYLLLAKCSWKAASKGAQVMWPREAKSKAANGLGGYANRE